MGISKKPRYFLDGDHPAGGKVSGSHQPQKFKMVDFFDGKPGMVKELIRKREAAKRWSVSQTMVTKYCKAGMPVDVGGKLDWAVVSAWRKERVVSERSKNFSFRTAKKLQSVSTIHVPQTAFCASTAADVIERLHGPGMRNAVIVAGALNLSTYQVHLGLFVLQSWLWETLTDQTMRLCGENGPSVDYSAVNNVPGLSTAEERQIEEILTSIEAAMLGRQMKSKEEKDECQEI